jgi:hypothetical protein
MALMPSKKKLRKQLREYRRTLHWYEQTFEGYEQRSYDQRSGRIRAESERDKARADLAEMRAAAGHLVTALDGIDLGETPDVADRVADVRRLLGMDLTAWADKAMREALGTPIDRAALLGHTRRDDIQQADHVVAATPPPGYNHLLADGRVYESWTIDAHGKFVPVLVADHDETNCDECGDSAA